NTIPPIPAIPSSSRTIGPACAENFVKKWAAEADLKKWAALTIVAALAVTLTLGSVIVLVSATIAISRITNPAVRALGTVAELLAGMLWLVGTIYVATHLAVLVFGNHGSPRR